MATPSKKFHQTVRNPFHKKPASGIGPKRRLLSCPLKVLFGEQLVHPGHHLEGVGDVEGIGLSLGSAAVGVGVDGPPLVYEANGKNEEYFAFRSCFLIIQFSAPSIILTSLPIICSYVSSMSDLLSSFRQPHLLANSSHTCVSQASLSASLNLAIKAG
jgi:hypothetical protein